MPSNSFDIRHPYAFVFVRSEKVHYDIKDKNEVSKNIKARSRAGVNIKCYANGNCNSVEQDKADDDKVPSKDPRILWLDDVPWNRILGRRTLFVVLVDVANVLDAAL